MDRTDFVDGDAWCRYKFEFESNLEEIRLQEIRINRLRKERDKAVRWWIAMSTAMLVLCVLELIQSL